MGLYTLLCFSSKSNLPRRDLLCLFSNECLAMLEEFATEFSSLHKCLLDQHRFSWFPRLHGVATRHAYKTFFHKSVTPHHHILLISPPRRFSSPIHGMPKRKCSLRQMLIVTLPRRFSSLNDQNAHDYIPKEIALAMHERALDPCNHA